MNEERYLFLCSYKDGAVSFPCTLQELKYALRPMMDNIHDSWPRHGHGPEWRMAPCHADARGTIVLDLKSNKPSTPMTRAELEAL